MTLVARSPLAVSDGPRECVRGGSGGFAGLFGTVLLLLLFEVEVTGTGPDTTPSV
jgi:hypothetical protein